MSTKRAIVIVGGILLLSIALCLDLAHIKATPEIERAIQEKVKQYIVWQPDSPDSVQERFRGTSNQSNIYVRYYFHSITNLDDVRQGHPPIFTQRGPYTFIRRRQKLNVEFSIDNTTVEYNDYKYLVPVPELTNGSFDDPITTLNIPLLGVIEAISARAPSRISSWIQIVARAVEAWGDSSIKGIFFTKTVEQLLFGYEDTLLKQLNHLLPSSFAINPTFALVMNESYSKLPNIVYTGHDNNNSDDNNSGDDDNNSNDSNIDRISQFIRWHGVKEITSWKYPYVEQVRGTDGLQFKPGIRKNDVLRVWVPQLFRSMTFIEESTANTTATDNSNNDNRYNNNKYTNNEQQQRVVQNIPVLRFHADHSQRKPDPRYFQDIQGLFNVTSPMALGISPTPDSDKKGAVGPPLFISLPGYCGVDERVVESVQGIVCDPQIHDSYIDIEPTSGITLRAMKSLMLSSWYGSKYAAVDANIADNTFVPIFWGQESSEASAEQVEGFKAMMAAQRWYVFMKQGARPVAGIVAVVGLVMCVGGLLMGGRRTVAWREEDEEVGVVEEHEVDRLLSNATSSPSGRTKKPAQE